MKTLRNITKFGFLAVFLAFASCSSDDGGGGGGTAAAGTITATVAGSGFTSMPLATMANRISQTNTITIQGSNSTGKAINLIINGATQTGTYQIGGDNNITVVGTYIDTNMQNPQASVSYVAPYEGGGVAGSITISELTDAKIVGTFNFTGKNQNNQNDSKEITNGAFNLEF